MGLRVGKWGVGKISFQQLVLEQVNSHLQKIKLTPSWHHTQNKLQMWVIDLNLRDNIIKLLEENIGVIFWDLR
jgi:hypothetical protein